MKDLLIKLGFASLENVKIPLSLVLFFLFLMATPATALTIFISRVNAHDLRITNNSKQIDDLRYKYRYYEAMNEKLNAIMIKMDIQEELRKIEKTHEK